MREGAVPKAIILWLMACAASASAAIVTETYTDRTAFEARLGAVNVVDFDDIDTATVDPVAFATDRYAASHGLVVTGESGQYASRDFGFPSDYPVASGPNLFAPGPIDLTIGGGNETDTTFVVGSDPAAVAGFGAVFSDPDLPGVSGISVFDAGDALLDTVVVPEADGALVFRGIVAIDDQTGMPTAAIARVLLVNGTGWPAGAFNDGVPMDDFVFGVPVVAGGTTTTTSTTVGTTTTSTSLCPAEPVSGCRTPTVSGRSTLLLREKPRAGRGKLAWVWGRGAATAKVDFGDPPGATGHALCVYDAGSLRMEATIAGGGTCGRRLCWKTTRNGFVYRDRNGTSDGVRLVRLKSGSEGRARVVVLAKGAALALPTLPLAPPVTTQLLRSDGAECWGARFSLPKKNAPDRFKAASD